MRLIFLVIPVIIVTVVSYSRMKRNGNDKNIVYDIGIAFLSTVLALGATVAFEDYTYKNQLKSYYTYLNDANLEILEDVRNIYMKFNKEKMANAELAAQVDLVEPFYLQSIEGIISKSHVMDYDETSILYMDSTFKYSDSKRLAMLYQKINCLRQYRDILEDYYSEDRMIIENEGEITPRVFSAMYSCATQAHIVSLLCQDQIRYLSNQKIDDKSYLQWENLANEDGWGDIDAIFTAMIPIGADGDWYEPDYLQKYFDKDIRYITWADISEYSEK